MTHPQIVRAAYLHLFFDLFREIGIPVERALAGSRLPVLIEETPDAYVSLPFTLEWIARTGRDMTPMELGFLASRDLSLSCFDASLQASLRDAVSGLGRLERYFRLIALEDSTLAPFIRREGDDVRLFMSMPCLDRHPHACLAEWVNIWALIAIIRSFAGPTWWPTEVTLVSRYPLPDAVREAFGNTRLLVEQPDTSVLVKVEVLARPCGMDREGGSEPSRETAEPWSLMTALRAAIQPYLAERRAAISWAAEIAGMSPRTLQRQLRLAGSSYAELIQEARFELARSLLSDVSLKIIDVAMMSGYENPQHFSRAFRRISGASPSDYRRLICPG